MELSHRFKPTLGELRHRYSYHAPGSGQATCYNEVRESILVCAAACVTVTPASREQERALEALDEAMFLFNAAIARCEVTAIESRIAVES